MIRSVVAATRVLSAALLALVVFANDASAQSAPDDARWALSLHFENDLFADTDRHYTNGLKLTAVSPDLTSAFENRDELPPFMQRAMNKLLPYVPFNKEKNASRTLAFSLGQNIYTPDDIANPNLIPDDRPYAGWLYFATTFQVRTESRQDTFDVQIGVVGPPSLAEQAQDFVHRLRGIERPEGWDNQLRFEPGLVLAYERALRSPLLFGDPRALGFDVIGNAGGAIGNIAIYAGAGAQMRFGWNLPPDFGYSVIRPGGVTQIDTRPNSSSRERGSAEARRRGLERRNAFSFYGFAGVNGRLVARDIFLDGNTFRSSHDVDAERAVADFMAGVTMGYRGLKVSLARVYRTREFEGQDKAQRFGSITLSYRF